MAELRQNTWKLGEWYDQDYAGNADYSAVDPAQLWAWGYNEYGQLGQNNRTNYSSPVQVPGTTWTPDQGGGSGFQPGRANIAFIKTDNTLWTWGQNSNGALGLNETYLKDKSSPVQIPGTTWKYVESNKKSSMATRTDGTLWAWGNNDRGQLAQNNRTQYSSPVQIPGTTWDVLAAGNQNVFCTKTDGTLWSWGYNGSYHRLGLLGDENQYSSPVQIPGTWSDVKQISSGWMSTLALKSDNTLWGWGNGNAGQLAQNNRSTIESPTQIAGSWSHIAAMGLQNGGIKTDGTLWMMGRNSDGTLGQGNTTFYSSPVQIPGTSWSKITGEPNDGGECALATKTDGTLWAWGDNSLGELGQNNRTQYSSPRQVGSDTTWVDVIAGNAMVMGFKST
tara:strand:+ start:144 stop:1316 length:1173 start_codon:yes stop_codon:yes gene_type:complete